MEKIGLNKLREKFLNFFEKRDHLKLNSFSLVPQNDKSLLLINAGMAPMKKYFTGEEIPPNRKVVTCQKCIRTGDIENVGKTDRHGTFFEMLGNFSFADYFKKEAITLSWEFLTKELNIPAEKLYPTVYKDDNEAYEIWKNEIGVPEERIFKFDKDENFWEIGVGPCGPSSEIYYDRGEKYGCNNPNCTVGCECDRYVEIWNNVFTQFYKDENGNYTELENKNIDTGMGLERLAIIFQDVKSIFDVDTIKAIRDKVCEIANYKYMTNKDKDISVRIITDHVRSVVFMTSDGILPSNEGRGYVLRRLLRRAARHGKLLNINRLFLEDIAKIAIKQSKDAYPELEDKKEYILKVIKIEEEKFNKTIDQGLEILNDYISNLKLNNINILSGKDAFKLYDTYGFPLDLTKEILEEQNLLINEEEFENEMYCQKERARNARQNTNYKGRNENIYDQINPELSSNFIGYNTLESESKVIWIGKENDLYSIMVEETPFYPEGGGQAGDIGTITYKDEIIEVNSTVKILGNKIIHKTNAENTNIRIGDIINLKVNESSRIMTAKNHTATHLLQKALRSVLGTHVEQSGSEVTKDKLRFDFTHFESMTNEEIKKVETIVNNKIFENLNIEIKNMPINEAKKLGAMALFGEKYSENVRVVNISDYSMELCGGTHIDNTFKIGLFKILSETGIASGVRRIEAITGEKVIEYYKKQDNMIQNISNLLKTNIDNIENKIIELQQNIKNNNKVIESLKSKMINNNLNDIMKSTITINNIKVINYIFSEVEVAELRKISDKIKEKETNVIILFASKFKGKINLIATVSDDLVSKGYHAGKIIKSMCQIVEGKGGGKGNSAQAGGKKPEAATLAIKKGIEAIKNV